MGGKVVKNCPSISASKLPWVVYRDEAAFKVKRLASVGMYKSLKFKALPVVGGEAVNGYVFQTS